MDTGSPFTPIMQRKARTIPINTMIHEIKETLTMSLTKSMSSIDSIKTMNASIRFLTVVMPAILIPFVPPPTLGGIYMSVGFSCMSSS